MSSDPTHAMPGRRRFLAAGASGLLLGPLAARAQAPAPATLDKIKYSLDFRIYAETAPNLYGLDLGLFREQGIDVTAMDSSNGSVDSITRVAFGGYDFGVADVNSLVEFGARNNDATPKFICAMFDKSASAVVSLKKSGIARLADLEGRKLGVSTSDAGSRILPSLLKLHGVDQAKIQQLVIDPKLRNTMLVRGDVDAVITQNYTAIFDLMPLGVKPEELSIINYSDNGFDVYAQGLIASRKQIETNPDLVRRVALAFVKSWLAARKDPAAAIQSAFKRSNVITPDVETARLRWLFDHIIVTPNTLAGGIGSVDEGRLERAIKTVAQGFELPRIPKVGDIYDSRFMPPRAARTLT